MAKKSKKKQSRPQQPSVRLSQCMIVKNEERNIEKALGWAKGIAHEQIVVDTGSTDRTVEIAEKLGAKVYHFKWINDFSAAKNFAIDQASGNWIAFLDADEYFPPKDAAKLLPFLRHIQSDPVLRDTWLAIQCPLHQVDETGKTTAIVTQERLFRNLPSIRYVGKIHEQLNLHADKTVYGEDIAIIHTGYNRASYCETNKVQRNIDILKMAISDEPENINLKGYLAEALFVKAQMDKSAEDTLPEINELFKEVIGTKSNVLSQLKKSAYIYFIKLYLKDNNKYTNFEETYGKALEEFPDDSDILYYCAAGLNKKGDYLAALELLKKCESRLSDNEAQDLSNLSTADSTLLQEQIAIAKKGIEAELSKLPLLAGLSIPAAIYMRDIIDAIFHEDMQAALDGIFRLSNDEIPDEHAESYLLLAQNVCAICEHVDGWIMFQKELVGFLLETGRAVDASLRLKDLSDLLPDDEEVIALQKAVENALKHN
jgi:glycosyltransferase involved in cell wall biosynthesis